LLQHSRLSWLLLIFKGYIGFLSVYTNLVSLSLFVIELGARIGRTDRQTDGRTDEQDP